jgi:FixJ family two-component response regulator
MTKYCVLVVDDQRDIRRVLRAGLETIGLDLQVIDVPSGEEALLVLSNHQIDVLITDVRLPGISGLELKERARQRNPDVDLILITGLSDPGVRQRIEEAGVAAFFYKPVEMIEFLDAVKRCLENPNKDQQRESQRDKKISIQQTVVDPPRMAGELANLRQNLNANAALLLDERGRCVAQAGEIPDILNGGPFVTALLTASHAGAEISGNLGMPVPESYSIFRGLQTDILLAHVGPMATLLISVPAGFTPRILGERLALVDQSVQKLLEILQTGAENHSQVDRPEPTPEMDEISDAEVEEEPVLDEIFNLAGHETYKPEEVDAFWDSLVEDDRAEGVINANAISYDQARQLGLTPNHEGE